MAIAGLVVVFDQLTKWAIIKWVPLFDKIPINSFINITHQRNTGAAFSFLADADGWQRWFFILLATAVSGFIVTWMWRIRATGPAVLAIGLALVLGGAVGNVIDLTAKSINRKHGLAFGFGLEPHAPIKGSARGTDFQFNFTDRIS